MTAFPISERARLNDDRRHTVLFKCRNGLVDLGAVGYSSCLQLYAGRLGGLLGGLKPIFSVRLRGVPEITNCILFVYNFAKLHQLGTQV